MRASIRTAGARRAHIGNGKGSIVSYTPYIDPIEHAWRHCNPQAPLPPTLVPRAAYAAWAFSQSSDQGQPVANFFGNAADARQGLLTVAISPRTSFANEGASGGGIPE